jgi:CHASE2 domain-containing sensor protein
MIFLLGTVATICFAGLSYIFFSNGNPGPGILTALVAVVMLIITLKLTAEEW